MKSCRLLLALSVLFVVACSGRDGDGDDPTDAGTSDGANPEAGMRADPRRGSLSFDFGEYTLGPGEETFPCLQWTFDNDKPLYVNTVTLVNQGGFHHSNWYALPDSMFEGEDGFFDCDERGFDEIVGAVSGDVLFAQSTQALTEKQKLPDGVVIKIPPNYKVIAGGHLLNVGGAEMTTRARMELDLIHPGDVETVVAPMRLDNDEISIPANSERRFEADCKIRSRYEAKSDDAYDPRLFWVLPHYHELGNYFRVEISGGPRDGDVLLELEGFNADANGKLFPMPIDLSDADGLRFTCGYNNTRDRQVNYGLRGTDEMCTLLAFLDSEFRINAEVDGTLQTYEDEDGVDTHVGECTPILLNKNAGQNMPTEEEVESPLYVPEGGETGDDDEDIVPECEDVADDATPVEPTTLTSIQEDVFLPSCSFSSCHDPESPAANLDLRSSGLHDRLMNHDVLAETDMPLVEPGDPDGSWLYHLVSTCEPQSRAGPVSSMPRNAPALLKAGKVAKIRKWIADGAAE